MDSTVLAAVLLAALLHAAWNLLLKAGGDPVLDTVHVAVAGGLVAAAALVVLPAPAPASWPFLLASGLVHVAYFGLLAAAYARGDLGPAYTVMRGTAPVLVALATAAGLGVGADAVDGRMWGGVLLVASGVFWLAALRPAAGVRAAGRVLGLALANAAVIATYTLLDGAGARRSGSPVAYACGVFVVAAVPLAAWAAVARGRAALHRAGGRAVTGAVAAALSVGAYGVTLWATTRAPVPAVAALRETSVVFATLLATWRLREPLGGPRLAAAAVVAAGVVLLRMAGS